VAQTGLVEARCSDSLHAHSSVAIMGQQLSSVSATSWNPGGEQIVQQSANSSIRISTVARSVRWPSHAAAGKAGQEWAPDVDWELLDVFFASHLPLHRQPIAVNKETVTAKQVARRTKSNFYSIVLATVRCPGRVFNWASAIVFLILSGYRSCAALRLFALKGDPACDCEIMFLLCLLESLGLDLQSKTNKGKSIVWNFNLESLHRESTRKAHPLAGRWVWEVQLEQFNNIESVDPVLIGGALVPEKGHECAPCLDRVAVVSSPQYVKGSDVRVDELLNDKLMAALEAAERYALDF